MDFLTLDEKIRKLIAAIETTSEFNLDNIGTESGLGEDAAALYKAYFAAKGLVTRAAINFFRIGLQDTLIFIHGKYPFMRALNEAFEDLLSLPGSYLVGLGRPLGQNVLITRHLIPKGIFEDYIDEFDKLIDKGIITSYEVMEFAWPAERYSLDPSVFDYTTGSWKRGSYSSLTEREVIKVDSAPVPFDDVDLKILTMLKKSAATSLRGMAVAMGLSVDDVIFHLKEHVLGKGDPKRSMVKKYYVDFIEPGLFASNTMMVSLIAEPSGNPDELLKRVAAIPYASAIWQGKDGGVYASLYAPLEAMYAIFHEMGTMGLDLKLKDLTGYIAPWYYWNILGSLRSPASLDRNYRGGNWVFEKEWLVDLVDNKVKQYAGE
ncbi:MAG: hypothetical protein ACP5LS_06220 [Thermoprotei archaeon]